MIHAARKTFLSSSLAILLLGTLLGPGTPSPCAAQSIDPVAGSLKAADPISSTGSRPGTTELAKESPLPDQYGMSVEYGYTYDPRENLSFILARVFAIFDYGTVWRQDRPKALRFKVEGAAGSTLTPANDLMVSVNMLALYYPGRLDARSLRPYFEGGIGAIYTQYRVKGQGLHYNFNPLLGLGCELPQQDGRNPFVAIRLHHISNAELNHENRGVNSVELQIGRYF